MTPSVEQEDMETRGMKRRGHREHRAGACTPAVEHQGDGLRAGRGRRYEPGAQAPLRTGDGHVLCLQSHRGGSCTGVNAGNAKEADQGPAKTVPDCGPSEEQPRGPGQGTGRLRRQPPRARGLSLSRCVNVEPPPRPTQRRAFPVHRDSDLWSQRRPWQCRCDQQVPHAYIPPSAAACGASETDG